MHYKDIVNAILYNKRINKLKRVYSQMSKNELSGWTLCGPIWTPYSENCESIGPSLTHSKMEPCWCSKRVN